MKLVNFIFTLIISLVFCYSVFANVDDGHDHRISSDDEVCITVFSDPDLSISEIKIGSNGTISMPLLGRSNVKGLTVVNVEKMLALAGGVAERASKNNIPLLGGDIQRILNRVLLNAAVKPCDVITLSESFL